MTGITTRTTTNTEARSCGTTWRTQTHAYDTEVTHGTDMHGCIPDWLLPMAVVGVAADPQKGKAPNYLLPTEMMCRRLWMCWLSGMASG